jgi:hypothetical protein
MDALECGGLTPLFFSAARPETQESPTTVFLGLRFFQTQILRAVFEQLLRSGLLAAPGLEDAPEGSDLVARWRFIS